MNDPALPEFTFTDRSAELFFPGSIFRRVFVRDHVNTIAIIPAKGDELPGIEICLAGVQGHRITYPLDQVEQAKIDFSALVRWLGLKKQKVC